MTNPTGPVPTSKRRFIEGLIRIIDLVIYGAITAGGVYAVIATPGSVEAELGSNSGLIWLWGALLFVGGLCGFVGRLARRWMVETPATILALAGVLIYVVVLGRMALESFTATVSFMLILAAAGVLFRRWSELQIFASGGENDPKSQFIAAIRRKTANFARHS